MLNIRNLLTGDVTKLRAVTRFGNSHRLAEESVAEHSYYVTLYAILLGIWYEETFGEDLDWRRLTLASSTHDIEEARTTDIPRDVKHASGTSAKHYRDVAETAAMSIMKNLTGDMTFSREGPAMYLYTVWETSKMGMEGSIIQFADILSTVSTIYREWRLGNTLILESCDDIPSNWKMFKERSGMFAPLFPDVDEIVKEMFPS